MNGGPNGIQLGATGETPNLAKLFASPARASGGFVPDFVPGVESDSGSSEAALAATLGVPIRMSLAN